MIVLALGTSPAPLVSSPRSRLSCSDTALCSGPAPAPCSGWRVVWRASAARGQAARRLHACSTALGRLDRKVEIPTRLVLAVLAVDIDLYVVVLAELYRLALRPLVVVGGEIPPVA